MLNFVSVVKVRIHNKWKGEFVPDRHPISLEVIEYKDDNGVAYVSGGAELRKALNEAGYEIVRKDVHEDI